MADQVTVESFNQLKNVDYKIYEASKEIRKQSSRRGRRRVTTINLYSTPPPLTSHIATFHRSAHRSNAAAQRYCWVRDVHYISPNE